MNGKNASQTPAIFERNVMVIGKIFIYWVTGYIAEEKKVGLKMNIEAYGGVAGVLVALGLLQPKV